MRARTTLALVVAVGLAVPTVTAAQDGSLRKLFGPPVQTLKQVFTRDRSAAPVAKLSPAQEAAPADVVAPPGAGPAPRVALVPIPRPRPGAEPAALQSKIAPARFEVLPTLAPGDFERRFVASAPAEAPVTADITATTETAAPIEATPPMPALADTPVLPDPGATETLQAFVAVPLPRPRSAAAAALDNQRFTVTPPGAKAGCAARLREMGIVAVRAPAIRDGRCGIAAPTAVSALGGGDVALTETAVLHCRTAEALAALMRDAGQPAAQQYFGGRLTGLRVAASYHCRTRNGVKGARLSEHALGNAIDISAFRIEGVGWVEVGRGGRKSRRFVSAVRKAACGPFTTVLGPGSDRYHDDHLHLDVATRGKNGRSFYCK